MKKSALKTIANYSNEDLRSLLKEYKNISDSDIPSKVKRSTLMKDLYKSESREFNNWGVRHYIVGRAIVSEIIHRIRTDKF